ncbi:hypothetical protein [Streptomyces sp. NPDC056069]|uniref:hypothetical protein n=1 Tax=Streptomyces sp. NPDC056069 TaxID=3345702 RepID=UPI0035D74514
MADAEREILDPAIVRLSLDHRISARVADDRLEWEYRDNLVRIVYLPTTLGSVILVAYVEVD